MSPDAPAGAIPFRPESGSLAMDAGGALLAAVLLLACALALALYARRKGWLARWTGHAAPPAQAASGLRVEQRLRLSRHTIAYRLRAGEADYLVVESSARARVLPLGGEAGDGD